MENNQIKENIMSNRFLFSIALSLLLLSLFVGVAGGSLVSGWLDSVLNPIIQDGKM